MIVGSSVLEASDLKSSVCTCLYMYIQIYSTEFNYRAQWSWPYLDVLISYKREALYLNIRNYPDLGSKISGFFLY